MQHKLTRLTALMLAVIMSFSMLLVPVQAASFKDVPENAWYKAAVDYVSEKGWMAGVGDMTFAPTQDVTRAMFVTVLAAYAEADIDNDAPAFSDTGAGKWYTGAAAWASEMEIVKGIGDGRFAPNRAITRQDLCTMLYKYLKAAKIQLKADSDRTYADYNSVAAYAKEAVGFCAASGLVTGFEDSSFRPRSTATRAQVAQILMRLDMLRKGQEVPDEPMPAQSFDGEAGEDMSVAVNAPEGALPENTKMTVSRVTDEAALAAIQEKVCTDVLAAADITFTKDGEEIEPNEEVEVQISLEGLDESKTPTVVHVRPDGNVEYIDGVELINPNRSGEGKVVRFYAQSFSVYALLPGEDFNGADKITITFHARNNQKAGPSGNDADWKVINKQVIYPIQIQKVYNALHDEDTTNDDVVLVYDPGLPDLKDSQSFEGWTLDRNFTESTQGKTVEDLNNKILSDFENNTLLQGEVDEYAIVYDVIYVVYHDQAGAVLRTDYKHLDARTDTAPANIDESYIPFKGNQTFTGWVTEDKVATMGEVPVYNAVAENDVYKVGETYDISETLQLYPYIQKGFWLSFNNNIDANNAALGFEDNSRAEYISPKFYAEGVAPGQAPAFSSAADKIRPGFTFVGWYVDPEMTDEYDFTKPLTQDTTVYAKWNRAETTYRVVFWQQKPTDDINAYNTAAEGSPVKSWSYYVPSTVSVERTATTGTLVSLSNADKRLGNRNSTTSYGEMGYFFDFNSELSTNGSVRVAGDGSTVLNAYYNRKVITINFRTAWAATEYDRAVSAGYDSSTRYYRWDLYFNVYDTHRDGTGASSNVLTLTTPEGSEYPDENGWVYAGYAYSRNSDGSNYSINTSGSQCVWKRNGSTYNGTVYGYDMNTDATESSPIWYTYQGLYKAPMTWPGGNMTSNSWVINYVEDGETYFLTPRDNSDIMDAKYTTTYDLYLVKETESNPKTIHWMKEKADSDDYTGVNKYEEVFSTVLNDNYNYQSYTVNKFQGFTAYGHNLTQNSLTSGFVQPTSEANMKLLYSSMGSNSYIYYNRNRYHLNFVSNNHNLVYNSSDPSIAIPGSYPDPNSVAYEKDLADYDGFVPANGPEGYYFAGWYADPGYSRSFDFTTEKMQNNDVTVYAKWNPKWYRVVVNYKWSDPSMTVTVPGTTQKASFSVEYGKEIQASALLKAQRDGYLLLGLYFDKEGKRPFNPYMQAPFGLNEADEVYPDSERTGVDDLTGDTWSDVGYPDMRAKITLYALWRADPDGTIGYNVRYEGDQNEHDTGYFDVNEDPKPHIVEDGMTYVDRAQAYAHPASIPEVPGEQFLYWEVLDADYNPTGQKAYPGGTFTIRAEDASVIRERLPDPRCPHTEKTLVPAVEATCTRSGHNAYYECNACHKKFETMTSTEEYDPTVPALGHTWGEWTVTQEPTCKDTGVKTRVCSVCNTEETEDIPKTDTHTWGEWIPGSGDSHYHICSVCDARAGEPCTYPNEPDEHVEPQIGVAGYNKYYCTVCGREKTVTIPALTAHRIIFHVPEDVGLTAPNTVENVSAGTFSLAGYAPSGTLTVDGWEFAGWVISEVSTTTNEVQPLSSVTVADSDINLYALFTHTVSSTWYDLLTQAPSDWTGNYVITGKQNKDTDVYKYVLPGLNNETSYENSSVSNRIVLFENSGISYDSTNNRLTNVDPLYVFSVESYSDGYSVKNSSTNTYLYSTSGTLYAKDTIDSDCAWTLSFSSPGVVMQNTTHSSYQYLALLESSTDSTVKFFGLFNQSSTVYLWKENTGSTTTYATSPENSTVSTVYYTRVNSTSDLTPGTYLIVCENNNVALNGGLSVLDVASNTVAVTIIGNQIEASSAMDDASFTLAQSGSNWTIKSKSGYYIGRTASSNGLNSSQTIQYTNVISITSGNATIQGNTTQGTTVTRYLKYYYAGNSPRFRYYGTTATSVANIQLYKRDVALTNAVVDPVELQNNPVPMEEDTFEAEEKTSNSASEAKYAETHAVSAAEAEADAEIQPEPTRAFPSDGSHSVPTETYYVEVTQPIPGEKYLIAYESGSTVKIASNAYPTGAVRNISPVDVTKASHGSYGFTLTASGADLSDYLYTVGGSSGAYTFYNEEKGYLAFNSGGYPILTTSATASYRTWSWSTSTGLKNATWTDDAYAYFRYYTTNGYFAAMNSGASTTKLYKPVTVDVVSSGDTIIYQLASAPEAGKQYVIVIGDHAMTSNAFNTSNHGFAPLSVTFSGDTVIVPDASADSVLWYADGNSSDGFTFLNLASNKYVSLNSSDEYWLYPGSTGWAWTYDGTDLNNHCSEADNAYTTGGTDYYYYLSKSTSSSVYFTTSTGTGHNVKFYERIVSNTPSHTLTIHYVLAGGGTAASDYIATVIEGDPYSVTSPTIPGYNPNPAVVSGTMGSSDVEITVEYSSNVVTNEKWEEVTEIDDLDVPYLIGIEVNGTVYLVVDYNALNNSNYYAGSTNYAYLAPAVFGTGSDSAKIIGVDGTAANDLNNCEWKFETTSGGTVTGVTSNRTLWYTNAGGVYPYTSGDSFTFDGGSHRMYTGTHYLYAANVNGTYYLGNTTSANAGTVRIYKQVIDEDTVFTIHFQDEEGNDIIGFPDQPVQNVENARVQDPGDPNAAVHGNDGANDWYFLGWYEPSANAEYDFANTPVTGDLTLEARFSYAWEVKYTITLRAVYGMINTTGDTHIYWYANDGTDAGHGAGAGDRYESCALNEDTNEYENHIPMNEPTPIPYPAPYSDNTVWTGIESEQEGLYYPGHTFLGWARLETDGAGISGEGHPDLTEADLYLKWDEANHQYLYNSNGTRDLTPNWEPLPSGKVYATEDTPYHDMYAVWAPGNFYVFHSATGKIEAIDTLAVRNSDSGVIDLTQHVTPGYIYGGYYLEKTNGDQQLSGYGYISPAEMRSVLRGFEVGNTAQWATMTASAPDDPVASHVITAADLPAGSNFETYTGAYRYTNGTNLAICKDANGNIIKENGKPKLAPAIWNKASAANEANGDAQGNQISPVPGTVYYLKEVPSTYLTSKVAYTYDTKAADKDIQDIWLLTLADDSNYSQVGFKTVTGQDAEALDDARLEKADTVAKTFTLKPAAPSNGGEALPAVTFTSAHFGFKDGEAGYVAVKRATSLVNEGQPSFSMLPGWVTLDGIAIYNNGTYWHYIEDAAENAQIGWAHSYNDDERLYFDLSAVSGWTDGAVPQKAYFFKGSGESAVHAWVDMKYISGGLHYVNVPVGDWEHVIIVRINPNAGYNPNDESTFWGAKQKQSGDIPLNTENSVKSNNNFISRFGEGSAVVTWAYYPAFPS